MRRTLYLVTVVALAAHVSTPARAQEPPVPLFAERSPLELTIVADFHQLRRDRDEDSEERDGTVTVGGSGEASVPVKVRTRGRFRLQSRICQFPPLRLNFPKKAVEGTLLEGQDKIKLVTHCRDRDNYEENALEEYLVYRLLNVLTDRSFQVRLARLTYVDATGREDTQQRWGFLLESEDLLAERLGGQLMEDTLQIHLGLLRGRNTGLVSLFQFMVGNTDWSMTQLHNFVLVQTPTDVLPVPYDFDWTGFVNAPYARPDHSLGTRSVRQRVFREWCRPDVDYPALFELFQERRATMEAEILGVPALSDKRKQEALDYVAEFFDVVDDPRKAERQITRACREV
jgi:hypothetical protein